MVTRKANLSDLDTLSRLFNSYRIFYKQKDDIENVKAFLKERLEKNQSIIFVLLVDEVLVGFTQLYPTFSSVSMQHSYILNDLFVAEDHRKNGYGEALLNTAKAFCLSQNAKGLTLETDVDNPAQKLYERLGWKVDTDVYHYTWTSN